MTNAKYQIAISALDQYSAPFKSAGTASERFTQQVKQQKNELKQLNATAGQIDSYRSLKYELNDASSELSKAKLKTSALAVEHKRLQASLMASGPPTKAMTVSVLEAKTAYELSRQKVNKLSSAYDKQQLELHKLKNKLGESGIQTHRLGAEQRTLKNSISSANTALDMQRKKLTQVKEAQGRIKANKNARSQLAGQAVETAFQGAALAVPIKFAVDFESVFADVKKAVNDASPEELEVMRKRIITDAPKLGVSQEGLAGIIAEGGRNGIKKEELFDFAASAAKMSVAFDMTADEAGASMMKWRTTMNLSQKQAVHLANAVNYVGDNMATNAKAITEVLVRQGAVITSAGLDEIQAASLSAAVLSGSANTEMGATATKNLLLSLTAGSAASGGQKSALETLGFDPLQLAQEMQQNAPETVEQVLLAIKSQDDATQTSLMKSLFGSESIGSIAPLLKNLDNFRKAFKLIEKDTNFAGSMQKEFDIQAATAKRKIAAFTGTMTGLFTAVGESVLPVVGLVLDVVTPAVKSFTKIALEAPNMTAALMAVPAAFIAIKTAAIAYKAGKLLLGQGRNRSNLNRARLGRGLDGTASSATRATTRLNGLSRAMDRMGRGRGSTMGGANASSRTRNRSRVPRSRGGRLGRLMGAGSNALDFLSLGSTNAAPVAGARRRGGRWGRRAAFLGGGTALSMLASNANAGDLTMDAADAVSIVGDTLKSLPLSGMMASGAGMVGKVVRPLNVVLQGAALTSAISNGDSKEVGSTAGSIAGGLGGGALGAAIGTAIFPGIGTLIGGALGGLAGGELGSWLGGESASLFDDDKIMENKLPSPESVAKSVSQNNSRSIVFSPQITIPSSSGNSANDTAMVDTLIERMKSDLIGVMAGNGVDIRMDAGLTDRNELS